MDDPIRTGFQSKYFFDPHYRRMSVGRDLAEEEYLKSQEEESKVKKIPPNEENDPDPGKATHEKLHQLVEQSKAPLLKVTTAIPLNPFPNKVIVDIHKVTIVYTYFFFSEQIHSVFVKDISDVLVETSWFFSTLKIIDVGYTENSIDVNYLTTDDAKKARKVIQGLIVAHKQGLDLSKYELPDLSQKLEELGRAERSI